VDELFANIDLEKFVLDYNRGVNILDLKRKYNITSSKSLTNFINSLISLHKIKRRKNEEAQKSNTIKSNIQKKNAEIRTVDQKRHVKVSEMTNSESDFIDTTKLETELMLFEYSNTSSKDDEKSINPPNQNSRQNIVKKSVNESNDIEKNYVELIKQYDKLGLSEFFISSLLNISMLKLKDLRDDYTIAKNKDVVNPSLMIKKIRFEIDGLRLYRYIFEHSHADFLDAIPEKFGIVRKEIDTIVDKNPDIKKCRLEYFVQGANTTIQTLKYFHQYAYKEIAFIDKPGLLLKISEVLLKRISKKIPNEIELKDILDKLLFENPKDKTVFSDVDAKILLTLLIYPNKRTNFVCNLCEDSSHYEKKLNALTDRLQKYEEIIPKILEIELKRKGLKTITEITPMERDKINKIQESIVKVLEYKGEKGITSLGLISIMKKTFKIDSLFIKYSILELYKKGMLVKVQDEGPSTWILKKYYQNIETDEDISIEIHARPITPTDFDTQISQISKGKLSATENTLVNRIAGLFLINSYIVKATDSNANTDFVVEKENLLYHVVVSIGLLSRALLLKYYEHIPRGYKLLIVAVTEVSKDLDNFAKSLDVRIMNRNQLYEEFLSQNKEPSLIGSVVQIMNGRFEGRFGIVLSNQFDKKKQQIKFLDTDETANIFYGSMAEIPSSSNYYTNIEKFSGFLKLLRELTLPAEFEKGLLVKRTIKQKKIIKTEPNYYGKYNYRNFERYGRRGHLSERRQEDERPIEHIKNEGVNSWNYENIREINFEGQTFEIKINLRKRLTTGFLYFDKEMYNDTPRDFCTHNVLSCSCFAWTDQTDGVLMLCRHMISLLIEWWNIDNVDNLIQGVENLRFFCHDSFVIYSVFIAIAKTRNIELFNIVREVLRLKENENYSWFTFEGITRMLMNKNRIQVYRDQSILLGIVKEYPSINAVFARIPKMYVGPILQTFEDIIKIDWDTN
jgi:hypothetical protein